MPRRRSPRVVAGALAVAGVLVLVAGGCGSSSRNASGGGTIASTVVAGPATTGQPTPPSTPISIPTATDGTSPDGSGCDPPPGDTLPDGIWFGVLKTVDVAGGTIGLDLACRFSGTAAQAATGSASPVNDDYYVRNLNPKVYQVPTVAQVAVVPLAVAPGGGLTGGNGTAVTGLANASAIATGTSKHYVWIEVTAGKATVIQAQFTP